MVSSTSSRGSVRSKKRSKRKGIQKAAVVQTSLPPQVDGQIRCFLVVKITKISWKMSDPPAQPLLRVKWWGELTDGTIFSPGQRRVCARYAVRSGPKQFAEYLTDMGTLVMEVVDGSNMSLMGKVQVYGLNALTAERPIVGPYPIFSSKADILGHVSVNISIQSLNVFDDSSSTAVPTTDLDTSDARSLSLRRSSQLESGDHQGPNEKSPSMKHLAEEGPVLDKKSPSPRLRRKSGGARKTAKFKTIASITDTRAYSDTKGDVVSLLLARGERLRAAMATSVVDDLLPEERFMSTNLSAQSSSNRVQALPVYSEVDRPWAAAVPKSHLQATMPSTYTRSPLETRGRYSFEPVANAPDKMVQLLFGDSMIAKSDILPGLNIDLTDDDRSISDEFNFDQSADSDPLHDEELVERLFYGKMKNSVDASLDTDDASLLSMSVSGGTSVGRSVKTAAGSERLSHIEGSSARLDGQDMLRDPTTFTERLGGGQIPAIKNGSAVAPTAPRGSEADRSDSSSHVSFDLAPSDDEDRSHGARLLPSPALQLDAQQLTLLGQVKIARVCIDSLVLKQAGEVEQPVGKQPVIRRLDSAIRKRGHSKPPAAPPLAAKGVQGSASSSGTYFIEYQFPVAAASRDCSEANATATETVRAVSRKFDIEAVKSGDVVFTNHAVFPTFFDGDAVKRWWSSVLVFKVFCRPVGEKMVLPFGTASLPMQSILQSPSFNFSGDLEVVSNSSVGEQVKTAPRSKLGRARTASFGSRSKQSSVLGLLKVKIELTSDSSSFAAALREYAHKREQAANIARLMGPSVASRNQGHAIAVPTSEEHNHRKEAELPAPLVVRTDSVPRQEIGPTGDRVDSKTKLPTDADLPVHVLLHITCGRGFDETYDYGSGRVSATGLNLYVVCRGFWDEADSLVSSVCWNSANPIFSLLETVPVWINDDVLLRLKNNFMIIEVWLKKKVLASADELVGLVKVPLNILYASFRDRRISQLLLKSEYPVICVDNYMPVTCPFTGDRRGELHVLLAAGSRDQITDVQAARSCRETSAVVTAAAVPVKEGAACSRSAPVDQSSVGLSTCTPANADLEHLYEIVVGEIRSFTPSEDMLWGEADCFVQYHFPSQDHGTLLTKAFRTSTVLCVPNPTFDFKTAHSFRLPATQHIQATLLKAAGCAAPGSCIPFEVWARFYHPNVRDQLLARGRLPLAKLCALATMQQQNSEDSMAQACFTVPLSPANGCGKVGSAGLLDVSVSYKKMQCGGDSRLGHGSTSVGPESVLQLSTTAVTIRLSVQRACGLQSATRALARKQKSMEYFSQVGPNVFVKVTLANVFLAVQDFRVSPTVARNFCPEFHYYADFQCPVVSSNGTSLAESLESAQAVVELWHQAEHEVAFGSQSAETDVLLGVATVPLRALVTHKTGISSWFPVTAPLGVVAVTGDPLYGGLEVEVKFANSFDRQIVIDAANKIGWLIPGDSVDTIIAAGPSSRAHCIFTIDVSCLRMSADVVTPAAEVESLLSASSSKAACYIKYTFFDSDTFYSEPLYLEKDGQSAFSRKRVSEKFKKIVTPPLLWFLHENRLEIQLWLTYGDPNFSVLDVGAAYDNQFAPPYTTDRYLGSAYIDLSDLAGSEEAVVSDIYPLYNKSSLRAGQSSIEVHVTRSSVEEQLPLKKPQESNLDGKDFCTNSESDSQSAEASSDGVKLRVVIDQALHLKLLPGDGSTFVTFTWNGREQKSNSEKPSANCVQWMHETIVTLSEDQLHEVKDIVFKVWQETITGQRVLGFVSVDLTPLLHGLPELAGWYNVMDFSSLCQGQIKIGVFPLGPLATNKPDSASAAGVCDVCPSADRQSAQAVRFAYRTSAIYDRFPEHIAQFSEQQIQAKLSDSPPKSLLSHRDAHVSGVRRHHRALRSSAGTFDEQLHEVGSEKQRDDALQTQLRTTLSELDDLTAALKQKLRLSSVGKSRHSYLDSAAQRMPDSTASARQITGCSHVTTVSAASSEIAVKTTQAPTVPKSDCDSSEEYGLGNRHWTPKAASPTRDIDAPEGSGDDSSDDSGDEIVSADTRVINEYPCSPDAAAFHVPSLAVVADSSEVTADDGAAVTSRMPQSLASASTEPARQPLVSAIDAESVTAGETWSPRTLNGDSSEGEKTSSNGCRASPVPESLSPVRDDSPANDLWSESDAWSPGVSLAAYLNDNGTDVAEADVAATHSRRTAAIASHLGGIASAVSHRQQAPGHGNSPVFDEHADAADDRGTSIWHGSQTNLDELSVTGDSTVAGRQRDDSDGDDVAARCHRREDDEVAVWTADEPAAGGDALPITVGTDAIAVDRMLTATANLTTRPGEPTAVPAAEMPPQKDVEFDRSALPPSIAHSGDNRLALDVADYLHGDQSSYDNPLAAPVVRATLPAAVTGHTHAAGGQVTPASAAARADHCRSLLTASGDAVRPQGSVGQRETSCTAGIQSESVVATGRALSSHVNEGLSSVCPESDSANTGTADVGATSTAEECVNFFPTAAELESSMRAVRLASTVSAAMQEDVTAVDVSRFARKPRPLALAVGLAPTSETTRRLARIFSTRFTSDTR